MPRRKVPVFGVDEEAYQHHLQQRAAIKTRLRKREPPKPKTDPRAGAVGAVSAALGSLATPNALPYDGVLGTPPNWIPAPKLYDFREAREALLKSPLVKAWRTGRGHGQRAAGAKIVRGWLKEYVAAVNWKAGESPPSMDYPDEHADQLRVLAEVWLMVEAGQDNGYRMYLGEAAHRELSAQVAREDAPKVIRRHNQEISRRPRTRKVDPVTQEIIAILTSNPNLSAKEVRKQLEPLEQRGFPIPTEIKDRVYRARKEARKKIRA